MANYAVVNTDNMSGTDDQSLLVSLRYYAENDDEELEVAAIENGNIVVLGDYESSSSVPTTREVRVATTPTATTALKNVALVANPEVLYDETVRHPLSDYINEAGKVVRGYRFHENDIFSVTAEAFSGTPAIGKYATLGATTKIVVADSASGTATLIGKIVDKTVYDYETYYAVQVTF